MNVHIGHLETTSKISVFAIAPELGPRNGQERKKSSPYKPCVENWV